MSSNGQDISSTSYLFSNGDSFTVPNQDDLFHTIVQPGVYDLSVAITSIHGCIYNGFFDDHVTVTDNPTANFTISKNPITWFETTVQTNDISLGNIAQYSWSSPGSTNVISTGSSAMITYPEGIMGSYPIMLTVTSVDGCTDSITIDIEVVSDVIFYAPTAFTPNRDNINDVFIPIYVNIATLQSFRIFSRWGVKIFETNDLRKGWDGTINGQTAPLETYSWVVECFDVNGNKLIRKGMVTLLRY
jgi:gliding motility-associated-like protein